MIKTLKRFSMVLIMAVLVISFSIPFMMFPSKVYAGAILVITSASPTDTVENGEKLQMYAKYGSSTAVVNSWFITNKGAEETHTGTATIDEATGELTATGVGTVTVGATQNSPFATSSLVITITAAAASAPSRPLTPDEWVAINHDTDQLSNHYGPTSLGFLGMLYDNSMNRIPDASGQNYWNEQLTGGIFGANQVVEHFLFSDEIGAKVDAMTNEDYVSYLYTTLLSRNSDTDGYNNWLGYLNSGFSKEETLRAFLNNEEWINICRLFNVTP